MALTFCVLFLIFFRLKQINTISYSQAPLPNHPASDTIPSSLNFLSPYPHIFSSLHSSLKQRPNTLFPNGHSVVPCEIPPFTLLYHGRTDPNFPSNPEWLAFDAEMSYGIMGSTQESHLLTYQTTKMTKCLYFDGMSAAMFDMCAPATQPNSARD